MMDIHTIVIHYSATYPDQDITRDDIDAMHRKRGFRMIGYNWYIRRNGELNEGREEGAMTAGATGHNSGYIHICFEGGLERLTGKDVGHWNPTPEQESTMVNLIRGIQLRWPNAKTVTGHKNLSGAATQCPGRDDVSAWWTAQSDIGTIAIPANQFMVWLGKFGPSIGKLLAAIFGGRK